MVSITLENGSIKMAKIEYLTAGGKCKSATGIFQSYCYDGDIIIVVNGKKKKGMPVEWL